MTKADIWAKGGMGGGGMNIRSDGKVRERERDSDGASSRPGKQAKTRAKGSMFDCKQLLI